MDWLYEHMGIITFSTELWDASVRAGNKLFGQSRVSEEAQLNLIKWNDKELSAQGFVPWYEFNHPQLGPVEIGGWNSKFTLVNPPPQYLEAECHKNCLFTLYHACLLYTSRHCECVFPWNLYVVPQSCTEQQNGP